jgi:glutathione S-transferase
MIELHGMFSPNVRKVGIMLEELELDYTLHHVAVFRGDQFEPEFRALNPLGKVPVLVDHDRGDGMPVFESGAILFYLAETYHALLPAHGMARYEVMEWLMVQMAAIGPMFGQHNHFQLLGAQAEPYAAARYRTQAETLSAASMSASPRVIGSRATPILLPTSPSSPGPVISSSTVLRLLATPICCAGARRLARAQRCTGWCSASPPPSAARRTGRAGRPRQHSWTVSSAGRRRTRPRIFHR